MTIIEIKKLEFPKVTVKFSNGSVHTIDMIDYFSETKNALIAKILKDEVSFNTVILTSGALVWYGVGFDPDEMYEYTLEKKQISAKLKKAFSRILDRNL